MSTQHFVYDESYEADAAISRYRVVVASSYRRCKLPAAQDANAIIGVTQHATSASGDTVLVRRAGVTKLQVASASVTIGAPLRVHDIRGNADQQAAAWASGDGVVGYAEEASAASGDIVECWLAIRQLLG